MASNVSPCGVQCLQVGLGGDGMDESLDDHAQQPPRGLPAGRVTEMLGDERLGQQGQQEVAEDVGACASWIGGRWSPEAHAALEMLEGDLDAPS